MPLTGVNINNVSMDNFLRGVDAAKTLKALDKFTGRELAAAIGADNKYDLKRLQARQSRRPSRRSTAQRSKGSFSETRMVGAKQM